MSDISIPSGDLFGMLSNLDLTKVERDFPLINDGDYRFAIKEITPEENKAQTGHNLVIKFVSCGELPARKGDSNINLAAGFPMTSWLSLVKTEKYDPLQNLADLQLAALGINKPGFDVNELIGKELILKIKTDKMADGAPRNTVARYKALPAVSSL